MKKFLLLTSFLLTLSCSNDNQKIDGRDQAIFNETVDKIAKELPLLQQSKFKEALDILFHYRTNSTNNDEQRWAAVRNLVDNKTANDVFDMAEKIAAENNFTWNRNQVPLANGIPMPGAVVISEDVKTDENSNDINRFDFRLKSENDLIKIDPFFFNANNEEISLTKPITATIEVFNNGQIIYTKRASIDPNSLDALYRNNSIVIKHSELESSKLASNTIDILVRIPHPDKYLTQRKSLQLSADIASRVEVNKVDSVSKVINKDIEMVTSLSNRFLQNVSKKNYSAAFALTRNGDWATYQKFSLDQLITSLENAKVKESKVLDGDEKVVIVESNVIKNDNTSEKHILTLENINQKWFIVNVK